MFTFWEYVLFSALVERKIRRLLVFDVCEINRKYIVGTQLNTNTGNKKNKKVWLCSEHDRRRSVGWSPAPRADVSYAKYPWPKYWTPSFPWCISRMLVCECQIQNVWLGGWDFSVVSWQDADCATSPAVKFPHTAKECRRPYLNVQYTDSWSRCTSAAEDHSECRSLRWNRKLRHNQRLEKCSLVGWVCCNIWIVGIRIWCKIKLNKRSILPCW